MSNSSLAKLASVDSVDPERMAGPSAEEAEVREGHGSEPPCSARCEKVTALLSTQGTERSRKSPSPERTPAIVSTLDLAANKKLLVTRCLTTSSLLLVCEIGRKAERWAHVKGEGSMAT
ncbi:unnamed protein product [Durusdinium trenchii]|uniref:Uncharacterized protein n=1 Tax=Durusdinium trenchii TaxID=1381693 RepID=A0ABP0KBV0_9DINO